jgi:hypothetical protein
VTKTDLLACEKMLAELVQLAEQVDEEMPGIKGAKLSRNESFKRLKNRLEEVSRALKAQQRKQAFDDPWLTPAVEEAIAHLNGESGITRSLWILKETLADVRKEIAEDRGMR